jgi:small conductance mechanosensitive channel
MGDGAAGVSDAMRQLDEIGLFRIVAILFFAFALIWLVERVVPWIGSRVSSRMRLYVLPWAPLLRLIIIVATVALIVPLIIKPTFENLITILGAVGLALGFAFKDYVSSLLAGIVAIYEQPFRPGDWITINGTYGEVKSLGLRTARIVTPDDTVVIIPNLKLWDTNIFNANDGQRELQCVTSFFLHPKHDGEIVRQLLYDVALTSPYIELKRPIVVVVAEQPWGTHYRLKAYPVDARDQFQFISDLTIRGKAALAELGVEPAVVPTAMGQQPLA